MNAGFNPEEKRMEKKAYISLEDATWRTYAISPTKHCIEEGMTDFERGVMYACGLLRVVLRDCKTIEVDDDTDQ